MKQELILKNIRFITGPCAVESQKQVDKIAESLKDSSYCDLFRGGCWKPRTTPGGFEGYGYQACQNLEQMSKKYGLPWCTEIADEKQYQTAKEYGCDAFWIGARTVSSPFAMANLAQAMFSETKPILIKNPISPDIKLWEGAIMRLQIQNCHNIGLIFRGFNTGAEYRYRNTPVWTILFEMRRRYPDIPIFIDPSHIAGKREYIAEIIKTAISFGFDRFMIEVHNDPDKALTDSAQQLTPGALNMILNTASINPASAIQELETVRNSIADIDNAIIELLAQRKEAVKRIADIKSANNFDIEQPKQYEKVIERVLSKAHKHMLGDNFIVNLYMQIHEWSCECQRIHLRNMKQNGSK